MVETRLATRDARQSRSVVRCRIAAIIARLMPMPETPTMAYFTISLGTRRAIPLRDGRWGLVAVSSSGPTIVLELIVRGNSELLNKDNPECQAPPTRIRVTKPVLLDPDTAPEQECSAQLQAFRNASRWDGGSLDDRRQGSGRGNAGAPDGHCGPAWSDLPGNHFGHSNRSIRGRGFRGKSDRAQPGHGPGADYSDQRRRQLRHSGVAHWD